VEYKGKKGSKFYTGEVLEELGDGYFVNFLKRQHSSWKFVFPRERDEAFVDAREAKLCLPVPRLYGETDSISKMIICRLIYLHMQLNERNRQNYVAAVPTFVI
jgi:hypothetical protein